MTFFVTIDGVHIMTKVNYEKEIAIDLAQRAVQLGFHVFIAEKGTYGYYTAGAGVVSFQVDYGSIQLSGNYKTSDPKKTGGGWRIYDDSDVIDDTAITKAIGTKPPRWAVGDATWTLTTPEQYRATYQDSSRYVEFLGEEGA